MKKLNVLIALILLSAVTFGQNAMDALRYSNLTYSGTARFSGMSGAFSAVGADFSVLSTNPAGMGLFKTSDFTVTPSLYFSSTESEYFGNLRSDDSYAFNFNNLGVVLTMTYPNRLEEAGWRNVQFGFGVNRINDFHGRMFFEGFNPNNSMLTQMVADANLYGIPDGSITDMAYQANLIFEDGGEYFSDMQEGDVYQRQTSESSGAMNEMVFSVSGNYSDRLYVGVTLGMPIIRYYYDAVYTEEDSEGKNPYFQSMQFTESIETRGTGINGKFGLIFRATDFLRLGAAIHTPTYFGSMQDRWRYSMSSAFDSLYDNQYVDSPYSEYNYEMVTPWRAMGGLAFIFGTNGMLSADYEYVDYSGAKLRPSGEFYDQNQAISDTYTSQHKLRVGTEWRYGPFSFRGGYAYETSPYKDTEINDAAVSSFSLGLGYRYQQFAMDLSFVQASSTQKYYPYYVSSNRPVVTNDISNTSIALTLGYKF
jgi:hypothetical protein